MTTGRIHSIETMGLLDGPGIRTIVFLQGCPLRCSYCHNPDTQNIKGGQITTPEDLVSMAKRYKPYYQRSGGGITFSGGEPLLQGKFLLEALKKMKAEGIHTAVDTSGYGDALYYEDILRYTDYLLLDIKHFEEAAHKTLTGKSLSGQKTFLETLKHFKGKVCFRHVMVPGLTDTEEAMDHLADVLVDYQTIIDKIEILPYHKMGVVKYNQLDKEDPLRDIPPMDKDEAKRLQHYLAEGVKIRHMEKRKQAVSA